MPASRLPFPPAALTAHRGAATWGERLVPLGEFRRAAAASGQPADPVLEAETVRRYRAPHADATPVEGPFRRIAVCGGIYSNDLALTALLVDAHRRGAEAIYCLGDLGGFGPHPERVWPLVTSAGVRVVQGNYEQSLAGGSEDCNCGYTDPRDNHFAALSYLYTARHCSPSFKDWMGGLPPRRRVQLGSHEVLLVHGSPRQVNEFLFRSTSPDPFLEVLLDQSRADAIVCTHTGLHWHRVLPSGRQVVNCGALGRPANDGRPEVWYALLEAGATPAQQALDVTLVPLPYDHPALAQEMRQEGLPEEFVATILSGWWTTCLEILPAKEREASRY
jgi:hypothetical protein